MPGTGDVGHTHVGVCFPYRQTVSGSITVDVTVTMHNNPGTVYRIRPHDGQSGRVYADRIINWTPGPVHVATKTERFILDTRILPNDGWQEFRFFVQVKQPDGKEMHVSSGYQAFISNGNPIDHYRDSQGLFTEGRGWYTGVDYTVARIDSLIPSTVSGTWRPHVHLKPGAGGEPVTFHAAYIDPAFHAGSNGIVVKQGSGQFIGDLVIDTTTLSNGPHRLVLRADAETAAGTNSGLLVIPFTVVH